MNVPLRSVRRATLDDLPKLVPLWKLEQLPYAEFERRFKEFQVIESEEGEMLGAIGLQVSGIEARLHSESFVHFDQADTLRERFWARIKVMGENQGWVRVWTELASQTWRQLGFDPPNPEQFAHLPGIFAQVGSGGWNVVQLREDRVAGPSVDAEFQILRIAHQQENERMMKRAKFLRNVSILLAAGLVTWIGWWGMKLFKNRDRLPRK